MFIPELQHVRDDVPEILHCNECGEPKYWISVNGPGHFCCLNRDCHCFSDVDYLTIN